MTPELYEYWYNGGQLQWRHAKSEVHQASKWHDLEPRGEGSLFISKGFEFRKKPAPREHAELIKAWADGEEIEQFDSYEGSWIKNRFPCWEPSIKYRIKQED